jgi:hypothetical protein
MQKRLLKKIRRDLEKISILELSKRMKLSCTTLWRFVNDESYKGRMSSWDIIEYYYKRKK